MFTGSYIHLNGQDLLCLVPCARPWYTILAGGLNDTRGVVLTLYYRADIYPNQITNKVEDASQHQMLSLPDQGNHQHISWGGDQQSEEGWVPLDLLPKIHITCCDNHNTGYTRSSVSRDNNDHVYCF